MARGWESKSVESQIDAKEARERPGAAPRMTEEQMRMQREREVLELSRTRALLDLAVATNPRYREMLQASIDHLTERLAALDKPA